MRRYPIKQALFGAEAELEWADSNLSNFFYATDTGNTFITDGTSYPTDWHQINGAGTPVSTFLELLDTDDTDYTGLAGYVATVNAGETGLELVEAGGGVIPPLIDVTNVGHITETGILFENNEATLGDRRFLLKAKATEYDITLGLLAFGRPATMDAELNFPYESSTAKTLVASVNGNLADSAGEVSITVGDTNKVFTASVLLLAADIKNIGTTPIQIIPAPGANKIVVVLESTADFTWGSVAHDSNDLALQAVGGTGDLSTIQAITGAVASDVWLGAKHSGGTGKVEKNAAINITGTDSVATGDSSIYVSVAYIILDTLEV
tara:strand:- start:70897 stop:71862 length:966 start_codon:yes stop_codon:yes gene_type:complete